MSEPESCAEHILCDLISSQDIKPFGSLRKGDHIVAIPTAFGTKRRIHGCTKHLMMISYEWEKGAMMPVHDHEVEQISYVLEGKMRVWIGDEEFIAEKGDSYIEPKRVGHGVEALEHSVTIEVFTPPRPGFTILEMAAYHDLNGAYQGIKKAMEGNKQG
jgi:quercetin dioxygenase-like cupin family protein